MSKSEWIVRGYDSSRDLFEIKVPGSSLTEAGANLLVRCLAAQQLDHNEIVAACTREKANGYSSLLEVTRRAGPDAGIFAVTISAGNNPFFVAALKISQKDKKIPLGRTDD